MDLRSGGIVLLGNTQIRLLVTAHNLWSIFWNKQEEVSVTQFDRVFLWKEGIPGIRSGQDLLVFLSILLLAANMAAQVQGRENSLPKAVSAGEVRATIRGTGGSSGDALTIMVERTGRRTSGELTLTVPPGLELRSSDVLAQNMVAAGVSGRMVSATEYIPTSKIVVDEKTPVT